MRHLMWIAVLAGFMMASAAQAQSQAPMNSGGGAYSSSGAGMSSRPAPGSQAMGENCGTPDEPKACPPLPRHPLPYYPENKQ